MKIKSVIFLFIVVFLIQFSAFPQLFGFPTPRSTKLISKNQENIVGTQFTVYQYHSSLSQGGILQFYQNKLKAKGWSKMDLPKEQMMAAAFQNRVFNFVKGDEMLVLNFSPIKAGEFIFYSISIGKSHKVKSGKDDQGQPLEMFKEPESLDFMPIYPGSKQVDYREIPSGVQVGYLITEGMEVAKGFYLQKMPQYGWGFVDEHYVGGNQYDASNIESDCPTYPKLPIEAKEIIDNVQMKGVMLEFEQGSKSCLINIVEISGLESASGTDLTSLSLGDTIITVLYNEKK